MHFIAHEVNLLNSLLHLLVLQVGKQITTQIIHPCPIMLCWSNCPSYIVWIDISSSCSTCLLSHPSMALIAG